MGMKAMHGSRHVVIAHNQFVRNDLWSIGLMPGTSAHPALPATPESPARPPNTDGGSIIVGNLVSEFGHGDSHWIWDPERHTCAPFLFDRGQEPDDPPLRDVVISGDLVYATGRDGAVAPDGTAREEPPRYRWAVFIADSGPNPPVGLRFTGNLFHPGTRSSRQPADRPLRTVRVPAGEPSPAHGVELRRAGPWRAFGMPGGGGSAPPGWSRTAAPSRTTARDRRRSILPIPFLDSLSHPVIYTSLVTTGNLNGKRWGSGVTFGGFGPDCSSGSFEAT